MSVFIDNSINQNSFYKVPYCYGSNLFYKSSPPLTDSLKQSMHKKSLSETNSVDSPKKNNIKNVSLSSLYKKTDLIIRDSMFYNPSTSSPPTSSTSPPKL
jgi:hypothetical protein